MTPARKRNLLRAPVVLLVRAPLLAPLFLLVRLGEGAGRLWDWLEGRLPGFEFEDE